MMHFLEIVAYILAVLIVSLDFVRYVVWTVPAVNHFEFQDVRDTIILIGCQLLARLLLIGLAGKVIFVGMV